MTENNKKYFPYDIFDKDKKRLGTLLAESFYHAEEKAKKYFENYSYTMKRQPDPNRGDLYHEIIKHTMQIESLISQTNNKDFQNKAKRSLNSLDKIVKNQYATNKRRH